MNWSDESKKNICKIDDLLAYTTLTTKEMKQLELIIKRHPMSITPYYMSLIDWNDPDDPIRRIAVPSLSELDLSGSYDTSGESKSTRMPGLQHKYTQTALLLTTNRCPVYCRHCFRKRLVGLPSEEVLKRFKQAVKYIREHEEIRNVLISGGDPLTLPNEILFQLLNWLGEIPHLNFIRIGTRIPAVLPARITSDPEFVSALGKFSNTIKRVYLVTQFAHHREITESSTEAVHQIVNAGISVINQTVLLKGVTDDAQSLARLQSELTRIGVNPYYVFHCRPVKRVKRQFQIPLKTGYKIIEETKALLDGPSKRFRYIMSHDTGKIEIIGVMGDEIFFKYHQARDPKHLGRLFKRKVTDDGGWLDDLPRVN